MKYGVQNLAARSRWLDFTHKDTGKIRKIKIFKNVLNHRETYFRVSLAQIWGQKSHILEIFGMGTGLNLKMNRCPKLKSVNQLPSITVWFLHQRMYQCQKLPNQMKHSCSRSERVKSMDIRLILDWGFIFCWNLFYADVFEGTIFQVFWKFYFGKSDWQPRSI